MSDINITYKNSSIATMDTSGTKTIETAGKYCEDDITIEYVRPEPVLESLSVSENGEYTPGLGADGFSQVSVNVQSGDSKENELIERTISGVYANGNVSKIGAYAFCMCNNLSDVKFENCTYIASSAFMWASIVTANFPKCTSIDSGAFLYCYPLKNISFPLCTRIGYLAFGNCNNLTSVIFPECTFLADEAFQGCSKLTSANFPKCSQIASSAFTNCYSLGTAVFASCNTIKNWAFSGCGRLLSLYLLSTGYAYLGNSNTFRGTPIAGSTAQTSGVFGSIYVRASMLESYKTSGAWSYFSDRFVGLTDAEIEALDNAN